MPTSLKDIVNKHISSNKLYPRPTVTCVECNEIVIVCWGKKVNPYIRHKTNPKKCKSKIGDLYFHNMTIEILCEYLNQGRKVIYERKCKTCSGVIKLDINAKRYEKEVSFTGCRFDIAGFIDDKISFGIEVYNKHRTSNIKNRNFVEWTEVRADDILRELSEGDKQEIILEDIREIICEKCNKIVIPKCVKIEEPKFSLYEIEENTKTQLKGEYLDIAQKLGYLIIEYSVEDQKIKDIITLGKYIKPYQKWKSNGPVVDNFILNNKRCLKCIKKYEISKSNPFCHSCLREIKNKENQPVPKIWTVVDKKE